MAEDFEEVLTLPSNFTIIESEAFADLKSVEGIRISDTVASIADDAFVNSDIVIIGSVDSYAVQWAKDHDIPYIEE